MGFPGLVTAFISEYALIVVIGFTAFIVLTIGYNVLQQLLFKNPNEPPVVFHWLPVIGSTVIYGMEPFKFFSNCRAKVRDRVSQAAIFSPCVDL